MLGGILLVNLLFAIEKNVNCARLLMEGGIVPVKLFDWRFKRCSFFSFPIIHQLYQ